MLLATPNASPVQRSDAIPVDREGPSVTSVPGIRPYVRIRPSEVDGTSECVPFALWEPGGHVSVFVSRAIGALFAVHMVRWLRSFIEFQVTINENSHGNLSVEYMPTFRSLWRAIRLFLCEELD